MVPADIFARYHRMRGNDVLMVSGSDSHGTPVTLAAESRGVSVEEVFGHYHAEFLDNWERLGIKYDLFTSTHTPNHTEVAQDMFLKLKDNGFIYLDTMMQPYCDQHGRFLADRYVEGVCPHCNFEQARGDQCDDCGRTLDPQDLIGMACKLCGSEPEIRETEHFFLRLSAFEEQLLEWIRPQDQWRPNVRNFSIGYLEGGLHDRAITRDIDWGHPDPPRRVRRQADIRLVRGGSSGTCRRPSSGPKTGASRSGGATSGRTTAAPTTSWARTTYRFTRSSGRRC